MDMDYIESSGWISSYFTVKGSGEDVSNILYSLKEWMKEVEN